MDSTASSTVTTDFRQWVCNTCSWIYDEAAGAPDHDLPPGTRLQDIPDDWYCPECGVTKADFTLLDF
jgi:rubredoxin-NAD+ reductase